jgi:hypothetical protein
MENLYWYICCTELNDSVYSIECIYTKKSGTNRRDCHDNGIKLQTT